MLGIQERLERTDYREGILLGGYLTRSGLEKHQWSMGSITIAEEGIDEWVVVIARVERRRAGEGGKTKHIYWISVADGRIHRV